MKICWSLERNSGSSVLYESGWKRLASDTKASLTAAGPAPSATPSTCVAPSPGSAACHSRISSRRRAAGASGNGRAWRPWLRPPPRRRRARARSPAGPRRGSRPCGSRGGLRALPTAPRSRPRARGTRARRRSVPQRAGGSGQTDAAHEGTLVGLDANTEPAGSGAPPAAVTPLFRRMRVHLYLRFRVRRGPAPRHSEAGLVPDGCHGPSC